MAAVLCLNHPRREAAAKCTSCAQAFCRECITEFEGRMVCGACYQKKTAVVEKPKRDWFALTTTLQLAVGGGLLWLTAWMLGRILVNIPASFHEGTLWEKFSGG